MTDPSAPSSHHPPRRRPAAIEDLTLLVRVPDRPELIRTFTAAEEAEADAYAAANGDTIEQLPK